MDRPTDPVVYVAGPLTHGDVMANVRAALDVAKALRGWGAVPIVPHLTVIAHLVHPETYETWMAEDFAILARCDALVRIPGHSPGADREWEAAGAFGLARIRWWSSGGDEARAWVQAQAR